MLASPIADLVKTLGIGSFLALARPADCVRLWGTAAHPKRLIDAFAFQIGKDRYLNERDDFRLKYCERIRQGSGRGKGRSAALDGEGYRLGACFKLALEARGEFRRRRSVFLIQRSSKWRGNQQGT